jgi:hypothetical protein
MLRQQQSMPGGVMVVCSLQQQAEQQPTNPRPIVRGEQRCGGQQLRAPAIQQQQWLHSTICIMSPSKSTSTSSPAR